ncbi:MAG: SMC-Scp complex subunit ScpB [Solirubrobacteraceae bacterium]
MSEEESGEERSELEDERRSADQDGMQVTDQVEGTSEESEFPDAFVGGEPAHIEPTEVELEEGEIVEETLVASALDIEGLPAPEPVVVRMVEALLFLAPDPLSPQELADAAVAEELAVIAALAELAERYAPGRSGIHLRELGGGFTFASDPETEDAARRLFSRARASVLTPAQAETLAIVAYLQPVSRPEITRIRGVSADSAASTLLERGLVEESGRSQFGAVLYRTTTQFLKLFGLRSLDELPDVAQWDPSPEEQAELRERLLRAGEARAGGGPPVAE